jgi:hypothetical protein
VSHPQVASQSDGRPKDSTRTSTGYAGNSLASNFPLRYPQLAGSTITASRGFTTALQPGQR